MSTYKPANKYHPPIEIHCNACVNQHLYTLNARAGRKEDPATAITGTSTFFVPEDLPKMQRRQDTNHAMDLLDQILALPYIADSPLASVETISKKKKTAKGTTTKPRRQPIARPKKRQPPTLNAADLPCKDTIYRSDFLPAPPEFPVAPPKIPHGAWAVPYGTEAKPLPVVSLYQVDFVPHGPGPHRHPLPGTTQLDGFPPAVLALPTALTNTWKWGAHNPAPIQNIQRRGEKNLSLTCMSIYNHDFRQPLSDWQRRSKTPAAAHSLTGTFPALPQRPGTVSG